MLPLLLNVLFAGRSYFPVKIADTATTSHTHIEVVGVVEFMTKEDDGDIHMRLTDLKGHTVVCEVVPTLQPASPFTLPKKGDSVKIRGIARIDTKHHWPEVHPVEELTIVREGKVK